eukprot:296838-Chlamydomonas_euryale.AAC.2
MTPLRCGGHTDTGHTRRATFGWAPNVASHTQLRAGCAAPLRRSIRRSGVRAAALPSVPLCQRCCLRRTGSESCPGRTPKSLLDESQVPPHCLRCGGVEGSASAGLELSPPNLMRLSAGGGSEGLCPVESVPPVPAGMIVFACARRRSRPRLSTEALSQLLAHGGITATACAQRRCRGAGATGRPGSGGQKEQFPTTVWFWRQGGLRAPTPT